MNIQKSILLFSLSLFFFNCNAQNNMKSRRDHENILKNRIIEKIKNNPKVSAVILASTTLILGAGIGVGIDELIRHLKSKKTNNIDNNIDNDVDKKTDSSDIGKENCAICLQTIINENQDNENQNNIVCCKHCYSLLHEKCYLAIPEKSETIKLTCSQCKEQKELGEGYVKLCCKCKGDNKFKLAFHNKAKRCPSCQAFNSYLKLNDKKLLPKMKAFQTYKFALEYAQNKFKEQRSEIKKEANLKLQEIDKQEKELNEKVNFKFN